MRVLFVHRDFPAQFENLAAALAAQPGNRVIAVSDARSPDPPKTVPGVQVIKYLTREKGRAAHPFVQNFEAAVKRGHLVAGIAQELEQKGFRPDLVVAHPGWGESLYLKDALPRAAHVGYFEFYYHADGADVGFDPEFPASFADRCRIRTLNAVNLLALEACDAGISPTMWQRDLHPAEYRSKISLIHEGIDTSAVRPRPEARVELPDGRTLVPGMETVTFVARSLEPYRGFHAFMRALPALLARRPQLEIVILGEPDVSYGARLPAGQTYKDRLLAELGDRVDLTRVHFLGRVPYDKYLDILNVSAAHIYLTYPFVLSWSMLEAMACGCLVIGSATAPVQEVIEHERNGLLVDFFDHAALVAAVDRALDAPDRLQALRQQARQTIALRYDRDAVALPRYRALLNQLSADYPELS
jgi:glycosyltransferase involved in cell wall biosynthesis